MYIKINLGVVAILLTIIFVALRIANIIDWHWTTLIMPLWLPAAIVLVVVLLVVMVQGLQTLYKFLKRKPRKRK